MAVRAKAVKVSATTQVAKVAKVAKEIPTSLSHVPTHNAKVNIFSKIVQKCRDLHQKNSEGNTSNTPMHALNQGAQKEDLERQWLSCPLTEWLTEWLTWLTSQARKRWTEQRIAYRAL